MEQVIRAAIASIEQTASEIEDTFAGVGDRLGRGQAMFQDLNSGLRGLSEHLSGADIENTAAAFQAISERLGGLAEALPAESQLLRGISESTSHATNALAPLIKHSQMLMTIARSARIEAASLDAGDRDGFLDFTQEASELAKQARESIEASIGDQRRLLAAVGAAFDRQDKFSRSYRSELESIADDLKQSHAGLQERQARGVELASLAGVSTNDLSNAVGRTIVSLQAGDSARQRAEHVCSGLRMALGDRNSQTPDHDAFARLMVSLQAEQLRDTGADLTADMTAIDGSLEALLAKATDGLMQGLSLYGGGGAESASFLANMREKLGRAGALIAMCDRERQGVDESLTAVESTLRRFRSAITDLSETVIDITLIGMNAGLRAAHLGSKGSAFVVIANELKMAADQIADGAAALKPMVERIEDAAGNLRRHRADGESLAISDFEPLILPAIEKLTQQNDKLGFLIGQIEEQSASFQKMTKESQSCVHRLIDRIADLHECVQELESAGPSLVPQNDFELSGVEPQFAEHYSLYTMVREREVYDAFARKAGLSQHHDTSSTSDDSLEDMLF
jgi:hypothetical protein